MSKLTNTPQGKSSCASESYAPACPPSPPCSDTTFIHSKNSNPVFSRATAPSFTYSPVSVDLNRRRRYLSPQTAISCPTRVSRAMRNQRSNPNPYPPSTHGSGRWTPYGRTSEAGRRARPRMKEFMLHKTLSRVGSTSLQSRRKKHETWVK